MKNDLANETTETTEKSNEKSKKKPPREEYVLDESKHYEPVPLKDFSDKYLFNVDDPDEIVTLNWKGTGKTMRCKVTIDSTGHKQVHMTSLDKTVQRNVRLAHIVWAYHHGEIPLGDVIHHIDKDRPWDNSIENLEHLTPSQHCSEHNREKWKAGVFARKNKKVRRIFDDHTETYGSITEASKKTGVCMTGISMCCRGKVKTAGKTRWEFV